MRIAHTADWHIGKMLCEYSLLKDQEACLFEFSNRLHTLKVDALIISGDLYDRSIPSAEAVSLLDRLFYHLTEECGIEVFAIAGNHDSRERIDFGSRLMHSAGLHLVGSVRLPACSFDLKKNDELLTFWMLPYFELHHIRALFPEVQLNSLQDAFTFYIAQIRQQMDRSHPHILVAHGFFTAGYAEHEKAVGGSEHLVLYDNPFDYVALGHLHAPQTAGGKTIRYAGSPLKYSIDEAAQKKQFLVVDFQDGVLREIRQEPFSASKDVQIIRGSLDSLCDNNAHTNCQDYVFAELTDDHIRVGAIQRLKSVYPNALGLKYINLQNRVPAPVAAAPTALKTKTQDLFAAFFQSVMNRSLSAEERAYLNKAASNTEGMKIHDTGSA